jgi:hypothetical protein
MASYVSAATLTDAASYNALGQLNLLDLGVTGGLQTSYIYYGESGPPAPNELSYRLWQLRTFDGATTHLQLEYEYDDAGNVLEIRDWDSTANPNDPEIQHFGYDALDRLTDGSGDYGAHYEYDQIGNLLKQEGAMQAWTALVGTGATWDYKVDIEGTEWYREGIRDVKLGYGHLNYDAVANIHFGFVGRAAGFSGDFLVSAAGFAQLKRFAFDTHDPDDFGTCNTTYRCDHPYATWSIRFGIYLYELYWDRLGELDDAAFAAALEEYIALYGEPPDPPAGAQP